MKENRIVVHGVPAIVWGSPAEKIYLYVHGQDGCKEEAEAFASIACRHSWQVLSFDLPKHGERKQGKDSFDPWHVVPELAAVMEYAKNQWGHISLFANSIGAWFSMLSFDSKQLEESLFVSPVLNMERLISNMMLWANVSEARLQSERTISTSFGQTLSWEYLQYAKKHPINEWNVPTKILYGGNDNLIERDIVENFARKFNCELTIMGNGEHWFHTKNQLDVLYGWAENYLHQQELVFSNRQEGKYEER